MYYAKGSEVWVEQREIKDGAIVVTNEKFLTVHHTNSTLTTEQQAQVIAEKLNEA